MKTLLFLLFALLVSRQIILAQSLTVNTVSHYAPASGTIANPDNDDERGNGSVVLLATSHLRISCHVAHRAKTVVSESDREPVAVNNFERET